MKNKKIDFIYKVFDFLYYWYLFYSILIIADDILQLIGVINFDSYTNIQLVFTIIFTVIMYFTKILVHKKSNWAGIIGIIVAILNILFSGIVWKILGAFLLVNSIIYLVNYNKN